MKKLLSFDEFINESLINEGAGAAKMAKLLAVDFSAEAYIEEKSDKKLGNHFIINIKENLTCKIIIQKVYL